LELALVKERFQGMCESSRNIENFASKIPLYTVRKKIDDVRKASNFSQARKLRHATLVCSVGRRQQEQRRQ
jgi:hypothetical protein